MKFFLCLLTLFLTCNLTFAQHAHPASSNTKSVTLLAGLGRYHFSVSTSNAEAQLVRREFESAWKDADTKLRVEDL